MLSFKERAELKGWNEFEPSLITLIKLRMLHSGTKIQILFQVVKTVFYEQVQQMSKVLFFTTK